MTAPGVHGINPFPSISESLPQGFRVIVYDELGSTNDVAKDFARDGAGHGLVVRAERQTAGRGRQGRDWASPPGNLYMSVVLRPECKPARLGELSFLAAVAVSQAIAEVLGEADLVRLKWPNDILVSGAKVAGILMESELSPAGAVAWVILGVGVNLSSAPDGLPYPAVALSALGCRMGPTGLLNVIAHKLDAIWTLWEMEGFTPVRTKWLERGHREGDSLTVRQGEKVIDGKFRDLDLSGALVLETAEGALQITVGDVFPVGAGPR